MGSPSAASCHILGNLSKEPDFRRTSTGSAICELSVAVSLRGSNGQEKVSFIEIVVWGKSAENCRQYLSKGSRVYVDGHLDQERWADRNTGANRSRLRVEAERVLFLDNRKENRQERQEGAAQENTRVDSQYAPEPPRARFYGDPGAIAPAPPAMPDDTETAQDDIPF